MSSFRTTIIVADLVSYFNTYVYYLFFLHWLYI